MHYYSANPFPEMKGGKQCQKKINILRVLRQGIVTATTGCGPLKLGGVTAKKKKGAWDIAEMMPLSYKYPKGQSVSFA